MEMRVIFVLTVLNVIQCREMHLSCKQVREFVDGHNTRRALIAEGKVPGHPAASNMNKLVWDEELHHKAAKWATRKESRDVLRSHNPDKTIPSGRFITGENLYWYSTTDLQYKIKPESALDAWFSEYKNFTFAPLRSDHFTPGHAEVGHYTQMVWSDTKYIGCAISRNMNEGWHHFFVVCNYGPTGNFLGETPYKTRAGAGGSLICNHEDCSRPYGKKCSSTASRPIKTYNLFTRQ